MSNQLLTDPTALRMFFTDPVYITDSKPESVTVQPEVESPIEQPITQNTTQPYPFTFMGKNERKILLVVNDEKNAVSTPEGAELLKNILRHLKLTIADFAMINYTKNTGATFAQMQEFFDCRIAMVFGLTTTNLAIDKEAEGQTLTYKNVQILFGANLNDMQASNDAKKVFLNALKSIEKW